MPEIYDESYFPRNNCPYEVPSRAEKDDEDPKPTWPKEEANCTYAEYKEMKKKQKDNDDQVAS